MTMKMVGGKRSLIVNSLGLLVLALWSTTWADDRVIDVSKLKMFVDELPDMPRIHGYQVVNGVSRPKSLRIGMFRKKWVSLFCLISFSLNS